jgi:hypothetical protein
MRKQHPAIVALDTLAGFGSHRAVWVASGPRWKLTAQPRSRSHSYAVSEPGV